MRDHRKAQFRPIKPRHEKLAADLVAGKAIMPAMIENGYSVWNARRGMRAIPKTVLKLMPKLAKSNLMMLGEMRAEEQETLVRGRLAYNVITGTDKGVNSAKALGSDKRVNMFVPDVQTGVVVISLPQSVIDDREKVIEGQEE